MTEEKESVAKKMLGMDISAAKVGEYVASLAGKKLTCKDIHNIKKLGEEEGTRLANAMQDILKEDAWH